MKTNILDLIDFKKVDNLLEGFNKTTGFVTAILDLEGNVLSKSGWREICTHYHRIHADTAKKCTISDTELAGKMAEGEKFHFYKCLNGLVDVAVPVVINGEHIANLFTGQFFFEEPDRDFFTKQADTYGFDIETYMMALKKVPVVSKEKVLEAMSFLVDMTQLISEMTFQKLELTELNRSIKESEERFSKIFKSSPIAISITRVSDGKLTDVNDTWCTLTGFTEEEALGHNVEELKIINDETRGRTREEFLKTGKIRQLVNNIVTKNGEKKIIITSTETITIGDNQFSINSVTDITERIQAEKALKESEAKFKSVFDSANVGKSITLPTGEMNVNEAFCKMLGYSRAELQNKNWQEITPEEDIPSARKILEPLLKGQTDTARFEKRYICKNGSYLWADISVSIQRDDNAQPLYFITIIIDITERKRLEEESRISEQKYRNIFDNAPLGIFQTTPDGIFLSGNYALANMLGYSSPDEMIRLVTNIAEQHYAEPPIRNKEINVALSDGEYIPLENVYRRANGTTWIGRAYSRTINDEQGKPMYYEGFVEDITERKHAEEAMKANYELFRITFNISPLASVLAKLPEQTIIEVNPTFEKMVGYTHAEVIGKSVNEIGLWADISEQERVSKILLESGKVNELEFVFKTKSGDTRTGVFYSEIIEKFDEKYLLVKVMDITERKKMQEDLIDSLEYNRTLFDQSIIGLLLTTMEGKMIDANSAFAKIIGRTIDDTLNLTYWDITPDKYTQQEQQQLISLKTIGNYGPYEKEYIHKDGHLVPVRLQGLIIERNNEKFIWSNVEDITKERLTQNELKESEKRFKEVLENINLITVILDIQGNVTYCNSYFLSLTGYSSSEVVAVNWFDLMVPDYSEEIKQIFFTGLESGKIISGFENTIRTKSGECLNISWYNTVLKNGSGEIIGTASIGEDRTEQKKIQDAIQRNQQVLSLFVKHSPASIAMFDMNMKYMVVSDRYLKDYGITEPNIVGISHYEIFPEMPDRWKEIHKRCLNGQIETADEDLFPRSDGTIDLVRWEIHPWYESKDVVGGIILFSEVITDRKMAKEEIRKLNAELEAKVLLRTAQLEASNKELETFTYSVSHDLKAPLRGIDGYSKLLLDLYKPSLNEEAQTFIETIRRSTLQMNKIIDDLLDYSRLERSQLSRDRIKIKELIRSMLSIYKADLDDGRFTVDMDIADFEIIADPKGLTIALRNLLENAIKFTKGKAEPSIQIGVEEKDMSWIISVNDNGIGFNMQYHQKIFEIFQRLQRIEDFPGTGIGLAMVNKAMQRMHGRVWAESTLGMGSTFYLEIPKDQ